MSILGDPNYYSEFKYIRASEFDISPSYELPDEAFRIKPLFPNSLDSVRGILKYSKAFEI
ncbi:hypothetical protein [Enterococcus sp. C1]|uniref:hypothetical protein n=1 Tax=Enterococcus sp. C1 TaxID=1182762 RepID=UPI001ED8DF7B|nr:hypothetical protein [Enterococcus sp. C1]